jgi:hypothetical protein
MIGFSLKTKKRPQHTLLSLTDDHTQHTNNNNHNNNTNNHSNHGNIEIIQKESIEYYSLATTGRVDIPKNEIVIPCNTTANKWKDIIQNYRKSNEQSSSSSNKLTPSASNSHDEIRNELIERVDLTQYKDEPSAAEATNRISMDDFGTAMLRGMGWKGHGDTIGLTNKQFVECIDVKPREGRLGLGATEETLFKNHLSEVNRNSTIDSTPVSTNSINGIDTRDTSTDIQESKKIKLTPR